MNQQNKAISTKPAGYCVLGKFETKKFRDRSQMNGKNYFIKINLHTPTK